MEGIIHIAGAMPRIGTTTLALQMARFLRETGGYDACYVEACRQNYIWACSQAYEGVATDRATGRTDCLGIEMYPGERLGALREGRPPYDFIICDFGSVRDQQFEKQRFAGGDCSILVCGNKPNEEFAASDALADPAFGDALTVFNFTDPADYDEIRLNMSGRAATTEFMPYIPDPFHEGKEYAKEDFFQRLMDLVMAAIHGA